MKEPQTQEQRYEKLVQAVSGGELGMVKYLWELLQKLEDTADVSGEKVLGLQNKIDTFISNFKDRKDGKPGKDGQTPTQDFLLSLIRPLIPVPKDGKTPSNDELLDLITSVMPDPIPGPPGEPGKRGPQGAAGPMPRHEWNGTLIRFENPDGTWGEWKNLQGSAGMSMDVPGGGGPGGGLERVRDESGNDVHGISQIIFGSNLVVTKVRDGVVRVDAQGGDSGISILTEDLAGSQSGDFVQFDLDDLSEPWDTFQWVARNGVIQPGADPGDGSSYFQRAGNVVKVYNADSSERFTFQVTTA